MKEMSYGNGEQVPQCVDAEEAVLGGILCDPNAISLVSEILHPRDFYINAHSLIYQAALDVMNSNKPVDIISVPIQLNNKRQLDIVGGQTYIAQLCDRVVSTLNIDNSAKEISEKYKRRQIIQIGLAMIDTVGRQNEDLSVIVDEFQSKLFELSKSAITDTTESVETLFPKVYQKVQGQNLGEDAIDDFLPTGFYDLDELTGGLKKGYPTFICARTGMAKTTFAVELSLAMGMRDLPTYFNSLEMSPLDIAKKMVGRLGAPEMKQDYLFRKNRMPTNMWDTFIDVVDVGNSLPIKIGSKKTTAALREDLRKMQKEYGQIGLVVIDYVSIMHGRKSGYQNEVARIDEILQDLLHIARDFNVVLLGLEQVNRGVEARQDKRPGLADIRSSGGFEIYGAGVWFLYRQDYYEHSESDSSVVEVIVAKSRFGVQGVAKLLLIKSEGRFLNIKT